MYDWTTVGTFALGFTVVLVAGRRALRGTSLPPPPGPPGIPFVGNINGVDPDAPWTTYSKWAKQYGDLLYTRLLGKDVLIINSEEAARELLENRSSNYSDRPDGILIDKCGLDFSTTFMRYSDRWRLHRRFYHQTFRPEMIPRFFSFHESKACQLLRYLLETPEQLDDHVLHYITTVVMSATYDYEPAPRNDEIVKTAFRLVEIVVPILRPDRGAVVGAFPWLLQLPSWIPGLSFKDEFPTARECVELYLTRPFEHSMRKAADGTLAPSMMRDALQSMEDKGVSPDQSWKEELKGACGTAFLGGSESSSAALMTFFLMVMVDPAMQERAQAQIDAVVGKGRLPTMNDRPSLPFIEAIFRETLRFVSVAPLAFPHAATHADTYNGFHISEGAMLLPNLWSMSRNESKFPDPEQFLPERFLNDDGSLKPNNIEDIAFGFGRRTCPGKHLVNAVLWVAIAKVLAVFKILNPLDENGAEIPVEPKFSNGISIRPLPFKCRIVPRIPGMNAEKLEEWIAATAA